MGNLPVERFFSNIRYRMEIASHVRKQMNYFLAGDFNVFDYITCFEENLSGIIGGLLDIKGTHGQGNSFLIEFIKLLPNEMQKRFSGIVDNYTVTFESYTANIENTRRRMDIVIQSPEGILLIENKPFAYDQNKQLYDYIRNVKCMGEYAIIYMPGYSREPDENSLPKTEVEKLKKEGRFCIFPYQNKVKEWLGNCYKECRAEKVRWFLLDFIEYINRSFPPMNEEKTEVKL
jgi:hypothetical protein